jgi:hypothetical protein
MAPVKRRFAQNRVKGQHFTLVLLQPVEQVCGRRLFLAPALVWNWLNTFRRRSGLKTLFQQTAVPSFKLGSFPFGQVLPTLSLHCFRDPFDLQE